MHEFEQLALSLAKDAGKVMLEHFAVGIPHDLKSDRSPVTAADKAINAFVLERIGTRFPEHSLIGEEGTKPTDSSHVWVFDPIDGTAPYMRGIPTNVFAISLVKDGEPILGVVYDPYLDRMYHAVKGGGAHMNGVRISVSGRTELTGSYIIIDGKNRLKDGALYERMLATKLKFLSFHSTVYAQMLVASGQIEGMLFLGNNPWDSAAGKVIIEEAGGVTSDLAGNTQRYDTHTNGFVSAGNPAFHAKLLELIDSVL